MNKQIENRTKWKDMMTKLKNIALAALSLLLLVSCGNSPAEKKIKIGYTNWADCIAITYLTKEVLTEQGYDVELLNADVAPIFASISTKKIDVFMDAWLPVTHKDYMDRYGNRLDTLGEVYKEARIGLVVPDYVPISRIEELNADKERFGAKIVGIDAGSGIMKVTNDAIAAYQLDFNLLTSSGPGMTASLKRAIDDGEWVVVTGWTPHWMFERFKLKVLEDPKGVYGNAESIRSIAWKGFREKDPFAAQLISNIRLSDEEIASLMAALEGSKTTEEATVKAWMKDHAALIESWIPVSVQE